MTRAKQSAVGDTAQTQVGVLMRTGAFTRENPVALTGEQEINGLQPHTDDRSMRQTIQWTDHNPLPVFCCRRHNAGGSEIITRIGVGLKPLQGLLICGQLEMTKITSMSAVMST
jgi:hypothetical protein